MTQIKSDTKLKPEKLITPFKSPNKTKPVKKGTWIYNGEAEFNLENMGYRDANQDTLDDEKLIHHIKWNIAHKNYELLERCISIDAPYDIEKQALPYSIDVYGNGKVVTKGVLYLTVGDYHALYSRLDKKACKKAIVSRIALANVGVFVPYIAVNSMVLMFRKGQSNNPNVKVDYTYTI